MLLSSGFAALYTGNGFPASMLFFKLEGAVRVCVVVSVPVGVSFLVIIVAGSNFP